MSDTYWHLRITLETSAKQRIEEMAAADRRSAANYIRILIEDHIRFKETTRSTA